MGHVRRGLASLLLALLAAFAAGVSGVAAQPAAAHGHARPAAGAVPAMGRPPLLADDPADPTATPQPGPVVDVPPCPAPTASAHSAGRSGGHHDDSLPRPTAEACPVPSPLPTVAVQPPPPSHSPLTPSTGAPAHSATPRPVAVAVVAAPASTPRPRTAPQPLPILPPLWLTPSVVPVPQTYGAELAPTSVLVLGFGSVALASAVMTLRLLRRGR
jgi:hypothetical protein